MFIALFILWGTICQGNLEPHIDVVVAQDGTGNFKTIAEAISTAPNNSQEQYTIKIKAGIYWENVDIGEEKTNIQLFGDGIDQTIITGNRSNGTGWGTRDSATVGVTGNYFTAMDITFRNTAGPENGQAVALRSGSNFSAFFKCSFDAYQDTLYVYHGIQFYRECNIYGTVDIIFGNARVVLQKSNIYVHSPVHGQSNVITAQGRDNPIDNTGISVHNCTIAGAKDLGIGVKTYLGRPWRPFARTVVMQSTLTYVIDPNGWMAWDNSSATQSGIVYREYSNWGVGADTTHRVNWTSFKVIQTPLEAQEYTVAAFIEGDRWLPTRRIPFDPYLL